MDGTMGHFVITFRFESDSGYQKRYDSFVKRVDAIATKTWSETSSFYAIEATGTAESICEDLYLHTGFSVSGDQMLVIDLDKKQKATKGEIKYPHSLTACLGF
jgi:hypothetical protein